ncbi:MAG: FecR domain-containing protein [Planctomycetaceae bacterium]|nr:FecR domain-containing protein [Planctomycetaceae bacterium]
MNRTSQLIANYLDDCLVEEEAAELQAWLKSEAAHRREFAAALARDEQLRVLVQAQRPSPAQETAPGVHPAVPPHSRRSPRITRWMLTAILLVALGWLVLPNENNASVVTYEGGGRAVSLHTLDGRASGLQAGATFTTGTLQVDGEGTRANFSYADGSRVLVAGGAELAFELGEGRQLLLHHGTLAADVSPEATVLPLVLRTPTAEAIGRGTSFIVDARGTDTLLRVNTGSVRVRRLADDQTLLVAQNQQVHTEQNSDTPLQAETVKPAPTSWKASPKTAGNVQSIGEWKAGEVLKAQGRDIFRPALATHETHFHAGAHNDFPGLVTLNDNSAIRIRFRLNRRTNVGVFLSTHSPTWNFTGNFQAYIDIHKSPADADGWRTATLPIGAFHPLHKSGPTFQAGCVAATLYATTYADDVGLEVSQLEVIATGNADRL